MGAVPAYLLSALIPVGWVMADLFFLSRRFNFITAFLGLNAIVRGLLAFWFVDGALYAFKDTVGSILIVVVFGGSLAVGTPPAGGLRSPGPRSPHPRAGGFAGAPLRRTPRSPNASDQHRGAGVAEHRHRRDQFRAQPLDGDRLLRHGGVQLPGGAGERPDPADAGRTGVRGDGPYDLVGHLLLAFPALLAADGRRRAKGFLGTRRSAGGARTGASFGRSSISSTHPSAWKGGSRRFAKKYSYLVHMRYAPTLIVEYDMIVTWQETAA